MKADAIFTAWQEQADCLLPEFGFRRTGRGDWKSSTGYKVTGEAGTSGKVFYYANTPFMLKDYTRGAVSLLKYVMQREGLADTNAALQYMAAQAGVKYERFRSEKERLKYEEDLQRAEVMEAANSFFIDSLAAVNSEKANTPKAAQTLSYLKGRGYKGTDFRPPAAEYNGEARYMEAGFFPSYSEVRTHLENAGFTSDLITNTIGRAVPPAAGGTHFLTFPFRNTAGHVAGFVYRRIDAGTPKYLYDTELKKGALLFNLGRKNTQKGLTVVEGFLDAGIAYARGIDGVVAIGGAEVTEEQARLIVKYSGGVVRLCLDSDTAGKRGTVLAIELLHEVARKEGRPISLYVAELPEGVKDADELITRHGAEAFQSVLDKAVREYEYEQKELADKYNARLKPIGPNGELLYTAQDQDALIEEALQKAARYPDVLGREAFLTTFRAAFNDLFTPDAITDVVERMRRDKEQLQQEAELKKISYGIQAGIKDGLTPAELIVQLKEGVVRVELQRAVDLLRHDTYDELIARGINGNEGLYTCYTELDKGFRYPAGGTTLIAGRTSHGKTAFMLNSILKQAEKYKDRTFYFFSYEEAADKLLFKMLNSLINENIASMFGSSFQGLNNEDALKKYMREVQAKRIRTNEKIEAKAAQLRELKQSGRLIITDRRYTIEQLKAVIKAAANASDFGTAYIDYAQRIKTEREDFRERRAQIDYISATLCEIAAEIDCPLIIGAQLNRTAAQKGNVQTDTRPRLEHLKESGGLEEDANSVLTVYNEQAERIENGQTNAVSSITNLEIQALKNRDGRRNYRTVLCFDQSTRNISDMTAEKVKEYYKKKANAAAAKAEERQKQKEAAAQTEQALPPKLIRRPAAID